MPGNDVGGRSASRDRFYTPARDRRGKGREEAAVKSDRVIADEIEQRDSSDRKEFDGPFRGLVGPKRLWVTALFWLFGGWAGLHRLYLGDSVGAKTMLLTCGRGIVGWLADGFRLASMVRAANGESSQHVTDEALTRIVRPLTAASNAAFAKNQVSNTKYGTTEMQMWVQFFPLSLHEQMKYFTNR